MAQTGRQDGPIDAAARTGSGRRRLSVAALAWCLALAACEFKGQPMVEPEGAGRVPGEAALPGEGPSWRIHPAAMRVYPGTRLIRERSELLLEARLELLDEMGDSIKGVGDYLFELHLAGMAGESATGQKLYSWRDAVRTLAASREKYDTVTRTYRFRLRLEDPAAAEHRLQLRVTFMPVDGPRLAAEAVIPVQRVHERPAAPTK